MNEFPKFMDEVNINKEITYDRYGVECKTYDGQSAIVNDDYDEVNDELFVALLDYYGCIEDYITVKLEDIYWPVADD